MCNAVLLPDLIAFSTSMSACASAGQWQRAIQLLAEMKRAHIQPNIFSYNAAVDAFTQTSEGWAGVLQLLSDMHQEQVQLQTETYSSAMRACGLAGCWATALLLWEQLWQSPLVVDAVAMGAIISACRWDVSLSLLRSMVTCELRPDAVNFAQSIVAPSKRLVMPVAAYAEAEARRVLCADSQTGPALDSSVPAAETWKSSVPRLCVHTHFDLRHRSQFAVMAKSVARFTWQNAPRYGTRWLCEVLLARQNAGFSGSLRLILTWSSFCGDGARAEVVLKLLEGMRQEGPFPDAVCCNSVLQACSGRNDAWKLQSRLIGEMKRAGPEPDIATYGAILASLGRAGRWEACMDVLAELKTSGLESNVIVYSTAVSACNKGSQWQSGLRVLEDMHDSTVPPNLFTFSAAISACAKGQQWEGAMALLHETRDRGLTPDLMVLSAAILACGEGSQWENSISLLREAQRSKMLPNLVTFNAAFHAVSSSANWPLALELLSDMRYARTAPEARTISSIVRACGNAGAWQRGLHVLRTAREGQLDLDIIAYHSAVAACEEAAEWQQAIELLSELRRWRLSADAKIASPAIGACAKSGEWEVALSLLRSAANSDKLLYRASITACGKGLRWDLSLAQ
ncbi:PPR10 [Symbiodinium sp. CCMP2456]|nr:PPR10 [Symbiodinium sp. CCMP2456]